MSFAIEVTYKRLDPEVTPSYAHAGDAGIDLKACRVNGTNSTTWPCLVYPGQVARFGTGISVALPEGYVGWVVPRSGLGSKKIRPANSPGTVDSSYQGEIIVALANDSDMPFEVNRYDRIAQFVVCPVMSVEYRAVDNFEETTSRGENGFGSTGT